MKADMVRLSAKAARARKLRTELRELEAELETDGSTGPVPAGDAA
jgi:hypothetical protein